MRHPNDADSVGRLEGLHRRHLKADVELIDALDPLTRRTVAAWLADRPSPARRQACLRILASWLRWLRAAEPALEPLATCGAHVDAYCYAALTTGVGPSGRPLAPATVSRRRAILASFHAFAVRCGAVRQQRLADSASPVTREERRLLRRGIARLADDGRCAEALAVALLEATGASVAALAALTVCDLHMTPGDDPLGVIVLRDGDCPVPYPLSPQVQRLLAAVCRDRREGDLLISRPDGRAADIGWVAAALTDAALAGGLPRQRATLLHPHLLSRPAPRG